MAGYSLILICVAAFASIEVNHALEEGIYHYGNGKMWRVFTDGKSKQISRGEWAGTMSLASYNNRLFAMWRSGLYEINETSFQLFDSDAGYRRATAMVQKGKYLFATIGAAIFKCARLYRITVEDNTASKRRWGSIGIYPLGLTVFNDNFLIGVDENWVLISNQGDGTTLAPGSATAVTSSPDGYVFAIDSVGNVNIIDAITGRVAAKLTRGGIFTGSRSLVWFRGSLYGIGKDQRFYKIDIETGKTTILGTSKTWDINGRMTAIN